MGQTESRRVDRQQIERLPDGWIARYAIEGHPGWSECRVTDLSARGARLELHGARPTATDRVILDFQLGDGGMLGVQLCGQIKHTRAEPEPTAGIEFVHLDSLRTALVELLTEQQSRLA